MQIRLGDPLLLVSGKIQKAIKFKSYTLLGAQGERSEMAGRGQRYWSAQWMASSRCGTTARGDCVGICNMLMCGVKK